MFPTVHPTIQIIVREENKNTYQKFEKFQLGLIQLFSQDSKSRMRWVSVQGLDPTVEDWNRKRRSRIWEPYTQLCCESVPWSVLCPSPGCWPLWSLRGSCSQDVPVAEFSPVPWLRHRSHFLRLSSSFSSVVSFHAAPVWQRERESERPEIREERPAGSI